MAKQINCPFCLSRGDTVAMTLKGSFFQCPECPAQSFDNDQGDDTFIKLWKQQQKEYISRSFQPGTHVQGGGDAVGKSGKDKMRKKSLSQINSGLNGKCSSFDN